MLDNAQDLGHVSNARLVKLQLMLRHALISRENARQEILPRLKVTCPLMPIRLDGVRRWLRVPLGLHDSQQISMLDVTTRFLMMDSRRGRLDRRDEQLVEGQVACRRWLTHLLVQVRKVFRTNLVRGRRSPVCVRRCGL